MASSNKRGLWSKIGRYITIVTLACFFLPFFGVSCEGADVITISGADMVGGCRPGGLLADAEDQAGRRGGDTTMKGQVKVEKVDREPLAIAAFALALIIAGLAWVRKRGAVIAVIALSIASVGSLGGLYVKVNGDITEAVDKELKKESTGGKIMRDVNISAGSRFGFWATALCLIGVATVAGLSLRDKET